MPALTCGARDRQVGLGRTQPLLPSCGPRAGYFVFPDLLPHLYSSLTKAYKEPCQHLLHEILVLPEDVGEHDLMSPLGGQTKGRVPLRTPPRPLPGMTPWLLWSPGPSLEHLLGEPGPGCGQPTQGGDGAHNTWRWQRGGGGACPRGDQGLAGIPGLSPLSNLAADVFPRGAHPTLGPVPDTSGPPCRSAADTRAQASGLHRPCYARLSCCPAAKS